MKRYEGIPGAAGWEWSVSSTVLLDCAGSGWSAVTVATSVRSPVAMGRTRTEMFTFAPVSVPRSQVMVVDPAGSGAVCRGAFNDAGQGNGPRRTTHDATH